MTLMYININSGAPRKAFSTPRNGLPITLSSITRLVHRFRPVHKVRVDRESHSLKGNKIYYEFSGVHRRVRNRAPACTHTRTACMNKVGQNEMRLLHISARRIGGEVRVHHAAATGKVHLSYTSGPFSAPGYLNRN